MNSKLMKAGIAGAAVVALAAGGGTFAAWSDFQNVTGNQTSAGHLVLNLPNTTGPISNVAQQSIAPGESRTIDYFLTSADLDGVPSAALSLKVKDIVDNENGCASNSEAAVDTCNVAGDVGEFSQQAYMRVRYSDPVAINSGAWNPSLHECTAPVIHGVGVTEPDNNTTHYPRLASYTTPAALGTLQAGQGVCVRIDIGLDPNANNAVQGDSSNFNVEWDLTQIL